jgi:bifunctional DNA-binding transcriptional regulator/antitoxin component of YhaV-PrlF toxin-antitoxin module
LRRELNVGPGDAVMLVTRGEELHVRPYRQAIREAQAIIRTYIPGRERSSSTNRLRSAGERPSVE